MEKVIGVRFKRVGKIYYFTANSFDRLQIYNIAGDSWSNDGAILNHDGTSSELSSDEAIEALEYYLNLCD